MVRCAYLCLLTTGVNILESIARGSVWLLLLLQMRVCPEAMSVLKEILVPKTGET
jgi:hypothetical protein